MTKLEIRHCRSTTMHVYSCCFANKTYFFFAVLVAVAVAVALTSWYYTRGAHCGVTDSY